MGRTQPHGIAGHHGAAVLLILEGVPCLCFAHPAGPAGQKRHSRFREGPREAKKRLLGAFAPDCSERRILVDKSSRFGSRFRGCRRSVWIGGEPVAIVACLLRSAI